MLTGARAALALVVLSVAALVWVTPARATWPGTNAQQTSTPSPTRTPTDPPVDLGASLVGVVGGTEHTTSFEIPQTRRGGIRATVTNASQETAHSVELSVSIPRELQPSLGSTAAFVDEGGSCSRIDRVDTRVFICTRPELIGGGSAEMIVAILPETRGTWTTSATVRGDNIDPNADNDAAGINTVVTPGGADLGVVWRGPQRIVRSPAVFRAVVTNHGPWRARSIRTVIDYEVLEDGARVFFDGVRASRGSCGQRGARITCRLDALGPGRSIDIVLRFDVIMSLPQSSDWTLVLDASVDSAVGDPRPGNDDDRHRAVVPDD